ncbi:MAG: hypothetical protein MHMPM18_001318 [Marteilia pararefringens]
MFFILSRGVSPVAPQSPLGFIQVRLHHLKKKRSLAKAEHIEWRKNVKERTEQIRRDIPEYVTERKLDWRQLRDIKRRYLTRLFSPRFICGGVASQSKTAEDSPDMSWRDLLSIEAGKFFCYLNRRKMRRIYRNSFDFSAISLINSCWSTTSGQRLESSGLLESLASFEDC